MGQILLVKAQIDQLDRIMEKTKVLEKIVLFFNKREIRRC